MIEELLLDEPRRGRLARAWSLLRRFLAALALLLAFLLVVSP